MNIAKMSYGERLRPGGLTLQDTLGGTLPSIDILQEELTSILPVSKKDSERRPTEAVSYALNWQEHLAAQNISANDLAFPRRDILSLLYLDAIAYMGNERVLDLYKGWRLQEVPDRRTPIYDQKTRLVYNRKTILNRLVDFGEIYQDANPQQAYDAIEAIIYDAQCLILNSSDLDGGIDESGRALRGLGAEVKVLRGLRKFGWPEAIFSTAKRDLAEGEDVIIPDERGDIAINVKSKRNANASMTIYEEAGSGLLMVGVPMHRQSGFLDLSEGEGTALASQINELIEYRWGKEGQLTLPV